MNAKNLLNAYGARGARLAVHLGSLYGLGLILVSVELILPIFSKVLFDDVFKSRLETTLNVVIAALLCFHVMQFALKSCYDFLSLYIYQRLSLRLRGRVFDHLQEVQVRQIHSHSKGDLITRLTDDMERSLDFLLTQRLDLTFAVLQIIGISAICLWINSDAALVLVSSIPFYLLSSRYIFRKELGAVRDQLIFKKSEVIEFLQLKFRQIAMIKSFNSQRYESRHFESLIRGQFALGIHDRILKWIFSMNSHLGFDLWTVFATWYFGRDLIRGKLSFGDLIALLLLFGQIRQSLLGVSQMFGRYRAGVSSLSRIHDVLNWPIEGSKLESPFVISRGKIEFQGLSFGYSKEKKIFKDFSLRIEPNSYITIVGDYGAGKSTLVQLILGHETCDHGRITVDGVNITRYRKEEIRKKIIAVDRDQGIFPGTIRENITYGRTDVTDVQIESELKDLFVWEWISDFPAGLDTVLSSEKELSRSERQRLAIVRSLIMNPKVLILDEVISDLDPMSDYLMQTAITRMLSRRTVIAVTQNISALRGSDRILFMRNGIVEDDGNFETLMKKRGEFYAYYSNYYGKFAEFRKILDYEIERVSRHKSTFSVATFRIDQFDQLTADLRSAEISRLNSELFLEWTQATRRSDIVTEFRSGIYLVLLPEIDEDKARLYLNRARRVMETKKFKIRNSAVQFKFLGHVDTYHSHKHVPKSSHDVIYQAVYSGEDARPLRKVA